MCFDDASSTCRRGIRSRTRDAAEGRSGEPISAVEFYTGCSGDGDEEPPLVDTATTTCNNICEPRPPDAEFCYKVCNQEPLSNVTCLPFEDATCFDCLPESNDQCMDPSRRHPLFGSCAARTPNRRA